jgi:guanylate kinase
MVKKIPFVITVTGPSQSGKSLVLQKIRALSDILNEQGYEFNPQLIKKKTTREYRIDELNALDNNQELDVEHVETIPEDYDLVYQSYGLRYGLNTKHITKLIEEEKTPYAVINDIRAVEELKEVFPNQVLSIFLFRKIPDLSDFKREAMLRGNVTEIEVYARYEKSLAIYRMYIENIALFDKVILNAIEYEQDNLHNPKGNIIDRQLFNIIKGVFDGKIQLRRNSSALQSTIPKTFILAGNAVSGKDELIRAVKDMGRIQAEIIPKYTVRRQEEDDEEEMICRIIPKQELLNELDKEYIADKNKILHELDNVSAEVQQRFRTEWEEMKRKVISGIQDGRVRFWQMVESAKTGEENALFEDNKLYVDLKQILDEGKILNTQDDGAILAKFNGKKYVIYHAKGKKDKLYGCVINPAQKGEGKYRVLVASQYGVFNLFKQELGMDNVAVIYSHSQISESEFASTVRDKAVAEKREKFSEYLNDYVENIIYYDHVTIYATAHLSNEQSIKEEELIDQMFRLFRVY